MRIGSGGSRAPALGTTANSKLYFIFHDADAMDFSCQFKSRAIQIFRVSKDRKWGKIFEENSIDLDWQHCKV